MRYFSILAAVLMLNAGPAPASEVADVYSPAQVLSKIHHVNQMEIQAGELAARRGKSAEVRRYGDLLVRDHQDSDKKVLALARRQNLVLSSMAMSAKDQAAMKKLHRLTGEAFDKDFLPAMKEGHDEAISFLTSARKKTGNAPLAALISQLLPVIRQHDDLAVKLQGR